MINWDHFTQSLLGTLLHSVWQSGLLYILYRMTVSFLQWQNPQAKKNGLLFLIGTQLLLSSTSFLQLYLGTTFPLIDKGFSSILPQDGTVTLAYNLLALTYLSVLTGKMIHMLMGWIRFKETIFRDHRKAPIDIRLFTKAKAIELGIRRQVNIWVSEHIQSPLTFGYFKPVILLPLSLLNNISMREAETLILHELSHIRRYDYLINWFILVAEHLYFFNPFTRSIIRQFREEREKACDMQVLDYRYPAVLYAEALLKTARFTQQPAVFHLPATEGQGELIRRISFFTSIDSLGMKRKKAASRNLFVYMAIPVVLFLLSQTFTWLRSPSTKPFASNNNPISTGKVYTQVPAHKATQQNTNGIRVMYIDEASEAQASSIKKTDSEKKVLTDKAPALEAYNARSGENVNSKEEEAWLSPGFQVMQASAGEPNEEGKDFFIRDEDPATGTITTRAYRIIFKDGQWKNQFLWMSTETRPQHDTISVTCDSANASSQ